MAAASDPDRHTGGNSGNNDNNNKGTTIDFSDPRTAFATKTLWQLSRAYVLLKLCSYPLVVNNARTVRPHLLLHAQPTDGRTD
jgi:hypothetical protein